MELRTPRTIWYTHTHRDDAKRVLRYSPGFQCEIFCYNIILLPLLQRQRNRTQATQVELRTSLSWIPTDSHSLYDWPELS